MLIKYYLSKFKKGDRVEIISMPKHKGSSVDGFKGFKGILSEIELEEVYRNGQGSLVIEVLDDFDKINSIIVATGIITNGVRLKKIN